MNKMNCSGVVCGLNDELVFVEKGTAQSGIRFTCWKNLWSTWWIRKCSVNSHGSLPNSWILIEY